VLLFIAVVAIPVPAERACPVRYAPAMMPLWGILNPPEPGGLVPLGTVELPVGAGVPEDLGLCLVVVTAALVAPFDLAVPEAL